MKNLYLVIVVLFAISITACRTTKNSKDKDQDKYSMIFPVPDSVGYSLGLHMGNYLKRQGIEKINHDAFAKGMREGGAFTEENRSSLDSMSNAIRTYMVEFAQIVQKKMLADSNYVPEELQLNEDMSVNFGYMLGSNLVETNLGKTNFEKVIQGIGEQFEGLPKYETEEYTLILENYFKANDSMRIAVNEKYLVDHKAKEGVITTPSGLQYKVITKGEGEKPEATDKVKVHYKGTFVDGKTFDSSYDRGEPASFPLNQVIPGWTEGVGLMSVGSKYIFVIPYDLGYGEQGSRSIPPKSTLVFEVELLEIEK